MKQTFPDWLCKTIPETAGYLDVANLCATLFCTVEVLPDELRGRRYPKEFLAESFAILVRRRFGPKFGELYWSAYGASFHSPTDIGHWLEVMASVLKMGQTPDPRAAAKLIS